MEKKLQSFWMFSTILRPLVRFCLKRNLKIHDIDEILRRTLIEEARAAIEDASGLVSVSKISVVTGIHRVEVGRLLSGESRPKSRHDVLHRVVGLWSQGRSYRSKGSGTARPLTHQGLNSEFAKLVASISKEVRHYPILFELERIGAIEFKDDLVLLKVVEYTPQRDAEHGLAVLSDDIASLIETVESNVTVRADQPDLHLRTVFDNIDPARLNDIRKWILARGAEFHTQVREYLASHDHDVNPQLLPLSNRARVAVSSFAHGALIEPIKQLKPKKRGRKKIIKHIKDKI
jgi:hypothetical protein